MGETKKKKKRPLSLSRSHPPSLPRPEQDGAATGVGALCTYYPDPTGRRLDREQLYWELSQLTNGFTQMGLYTLVKDSLFVSGECSC